MPTKQPHVSFLRIREFAENWIWTDKATGKQRVGPNPPEDADDKQRQPFHLKAVTESGHLLEGDCVTLSVNTSKLMRRVQFVDTNEIRWVFDRFVIEINGIRFFSH